MNHSITFCDTLGCLNDAKYKNIPLDVIKHEELNFKGLQKEFPNGVVVCEECMTKIRKRKIENITQNNV